MHERSLVQSLLRQVRELACAHGASRVAEVRVRLGPLAGVEPLLLASAFDDLAAGAMFDDARLAIVEVPLRSRCRRCGVDFSVIDFHFRCDACGSTDVDTIDGDALILESVEFALSDEREARV